MREKIKLAIAFLRSIVLIPQIVGYYINHTLRIDCTRWSAIYCHHLHGVLSHIYLLTWVKEYRNVVYKRLRYKSLLTPPLESLYINTGQIGAGLFIQHGFSTIVSATSIGENCTICQQVTIGYTSDGKSPIIGNNVKICAGAIVVGGITIGDNSIIGAGAIVVDDVPANSVVCSPKENVIKQIY